MTATVRACLIALVPATLLAAAGCDGPKRPALVPVSGLVTYRGQPLSGGLIVFTPDDESGCHGPSALSTIGPDGRYVLMTDGAPGAVPGRHRVTVSGPANAGWTLPDRFRDPQTSRLQEEVAADRANVLNVRLEDR